MASIGHVMVGLAAARFSRQAQSTVGSAVAGAALWALLSLAPDADVIGFRFGVRYADPWGHRGATHSFAFAIALGLAAGIVARLAHRPALRAGLLATAVVASHAVLDTLTDGGLGCALLWPFSNERFFAPWTPLPVAPIGRRFFSATGARIAAVEFLAFAPFLAYALWRHDVDPVPRRRKDETPGC